MCSCFAVIGMLDVLTGIETSPTGASKQAARTSDLIFSVPRLVAELSAILPLWPGDVIFTGTPSGIGATRQPAEFLAEGDVLETWVEGIGTIRNTCTGGSDHPTST